MLLGYVGYKQSSQMAQVVAPAENCWQTEQISGMGGQSKIAVDKTANKKKVGGKLNGIKGISRLLYEVL